jgi:hypothetical protein
VQLVVEVQQLLTLTRHQLGHGDAYSSSSSRSGVEQEFKKYNIIVNLAVPSADLQKV